MIVCERIFWLMLALEVEVRLIFMKKYTIIILGLLAIKVRTQRISLNFQLTMVNSLVLSYPFCNWIIPWGYQFFSIWIFGRQYQVFSVCCIRLLFEFRGHWWVIEFRLQLSSIITNVWMAIFIYILLRPIEICSQFM